MPAPIVITIRPAPSRPGRFEVRLGERPLIASARTPFLEAARVLLAEGHDPDTLLIMRWDGETIDALRGKLGLVAKLAVAEDDKHGPRLVPYRPRPADLGR
jgi:hypothetical protein